VTYAGSTPVRQPVSELPESDAPGNPKQPQASESNEKALASLRLLWERRRFLFVVAACGLIASTLIAFVIPSQYESTARLMPPDNQSGSSLAMAAAAMSGAAGGLGGMATDLLGLKSTSDTFVGILGSRTVQDKLIQQFNLQKLYRTRNMEDARKALAKHTSVSVDRKSQIITIQVTDKSPQRAAVLGRAYVDELNKLVAELSTSSARRERIFLEARLQDVSRDLEAAEKEFSQFASKNAAIDIKEQGKAMFGAAAMLQGQLIAAQSELEGLKQIYTDSNVRVRSVKARISELKAQLEKMGGKDESTTDVSARPGDSLYPSIRKLPLLGVEYADLYRRTKIQEAVLETLTREYEMAKVNEAKEIPTVKVLDPANVPDKRSFPPRILIVFLGMFLASCFGVLYVLGSTSWDAIDPQDAGKQFALEVWDEVRTNARSVMHRFTKNGAGGEGAKHALVGEVRDTTGNDDEHS
jgi:uncharacterized protein involved in exopolysaccharide biosynthesis